MHYHGQASTDKRWAAGTGWLIKDDLLVTAGHCVYDWENNMGRVSHIKAYVGYKGKSSVGTSDVQCVTGEKVVTHSAWVNGRKRVHDFAIVKLRDKFAGVTPFKYNPTPLTGTKVLGIVGYPADKSSGNESGACMYEQFANVTFDLRDTENQLAYTISTYAGQSGSPVLEKGGNTLTPLATHVAGSFQMNMASPIGKTYMNPYDTIVNFFFGRTTPTPDAVRKNIEFYSVPLATSESASAPVKFIHAWNAAKEMDPNIPPTILTNGTMFQGPVVGPAASLAGAVLGYAGCVCESAVENSGRLPRTLPTRTGYSERALLAEGCLQYFLSGKGIGNMKDFVSAWRKSYEALHSQVAPIGPQLLHGVVAPGMRIALDALRQATDADTGADSDGDSESKKALVTSESSISYPDEETKAFAARLLTDTKPVPGEEAVFDILGDLINSGLKLSQTVAKLAPVGLSILSSVVGESALAADSMDEQLQDLTNRALLGQSCLDVLIRTEPKDIDEGFFDFVKDKVLHIGRAVVSTGSEVINAAVPVIASLLQAQQGGGAKAGNTSESSVDDVLNDDSGLSVDDVLGSEQKTKFKIPRDDHTHKLLTVTQGTRVDKPASARAAKKAGADGEQSVDDILFGDAGQDGVAW